MAAYSRMVGTLARVIWVVFLVLTCAASKIWSNLSEARAWL